MLQLRSVYFFIACEFLQIFSELIPGPEKKTNNLTVFLWREIMYWVSTYFGKSVDYFMCSESVLCVQIWSVIAVWRESKFPASCTPVRSGLIRADQEHTSSTRSIWYTCDTHDCRQTRVTCQQETLGH